MVIKAFIKILVWIIRSIYYGESEPPRSSVSCHSHGDGSVDGVDDLGDDIEGDQSHHHKIRQSLRSWALLLSCDDGDGDGHHGGEVKVLGGDGVGVHGGDGGQYIY